MNNNSENSAEPEVGGKLDRAHELTWALLDEHISDAEMSELEQLLRKDGTARESYIRCVQLHADLASHFAPRGVDSPTSGAKVMPILGFLNTDTPFTGVESHTPDGAH